VRERERGGEGEDEPLGVVASSLLEDFSNDGDGRVDRVGNDTDTGLGADLGDSLGEITNDGSVGLHVSVFVNSTSEYGKGRERAYVEEIVTGHSRLAGHTSGNDNEFSTLKCLLETVVLGSESNALFKYLTNRVQ